MQAKKYKEKNTKVIIEIRQPKQSWLHDLGTTNENIALKSKFKKQWLIRATELS